MRTFSFFAALLSVTAMTSSAAESSALNWPQFRGANCAGVGENARPPVKIGPTEAALWVSKSVVTFVAVRVR
jgi:hypothetical protein